MSHHSCLQATVVKTKSFSNPLIAKNLNENFHSMKFLVLCSRGTPMQASQNMISMLHPLLPVTQLLEKMSVHEDES